MSNTIPAFYEDSYKVLEAIVNEAYTATMQAAEEVRKTVVIGIDAAGRLFSQVDGLKAISGTVLMVIRFFEINSVAFACFIPLRQTFKNIDELLGARAFILRLNELATGDAVWKFAKANFPNLIRLSSRLSLLVSDVLNGFKFAEKMGVVAQGTGNTLTLQLLGAEMAEIAPMFGYVGAALELAENIAVVFEKGLNVDNGMAAAGSLSKMVSIYVAGNSEVLSLGAKAVGSALYFGKFIKTECFSN